MGDLCKALAIEAPRHGHGHGALGEAAEMLRIFTAASRQRMIGLFCRQLKNMQIIQKTVQAGTDHEHIVNRYTGKRSGADPRDPENKDDLVMSFGNGLLGALAFYRHEQFAPLRSRLGVRTLAQDDYHLIGF